MPFIHYPCDGIAFFRIFGFGLWRKDKRKARLLFSERNKIKCWHTKNYVFKILVP